MKTWTVFVLLLFSSITQAAEVCSWDNPGVDPFRGNVARAIMSYGHISEWDRVALIVRIKLGRQPDERVFIGKRGVHSLQSVFETDIHDMHFGVDKLCKTVTRESWDEYHTEPASMYCAYIWCIVIPDVCKNISWIKRRPPVLHVSVLSTLSLFLFALFLMRKKL